MTLSVYLIEIKFMGSRCASSKSRAEINQKFPENQRVANLELFFINFILPNLAKNIFFEIFQKISDF